MSYFDSIETDTERELLGCDLTAYPGLDLSTKFSDEITTAGDVWAWIRSRISEGNFFGIHVKDYIPFVADGNQLRAEIAGINTYKGLGSPEIGNHIDFITRELWPTAKAVNPIDFNNGFFPQETLIGDGATTEFVLTSEMLDVDAVSIVGGSELHDWIYDPETLTLIFESAPSGTIKVVGAGNESPWLSSDLYLWLNSLSGQIPTSSASAPVAERVDYSSTGVYDKLPAALKAVIVEKRYALQKRSGSSIVDHNTGSSWASVGKLWIPTEYEIGGTPVWSGGGQTIWGDMQYPLFRVSGRTKTANDARQYQWLLPPKDNSTGDWCVLTGTGTFYYSAVSGACRVPVCFRIA